MPRIVISYRRADSAAIAGRIFDRLTQRYGTEKIFMDIDEIPFGIDFRDHIAEVLATCDAVVAVMGQRWLNGAGETSRIRDETDPVRVEIQASLDRGIPVIPVLVEGAGMPEPSDLPEAMAPLAYRNACEVASGRDFHAHVDRLIRAIDRMFPENAASVPEASVLANAPVFAAATITPAPVAEARIGAVAAAAAPPSAVAWSPVRTAALIALLAAPQLLQFSQKTPLFVVALLVSTVGVVVLMDREDLPMLQRVGLCAMAAFGNLVAQGALGVVRASLTTW